MELGLFGIRETSLFINLILLIQQKWPNIIYYDFVTTPTKRLAKNRTPYFTKYFKNQKAASPLPTFKKSKLFANFCFGKYFHQTNERKNERRFPITQKHFSMIKHFLFFRLFDPPTSAFVFLSLSLSLH